MRSDFVAVISRVERGSIECETHDHEEAAIVDLLRHWESDAQLIGEAIANEMSYEDADKVLHHLLGGLDGDTLFEDLKSAGYDLEGKEMKRLCQMLLEELTDEDQKALAQAALKRVRE